MKTTYLVFAGSKASYNGGIRDLKGAFTSLDDATACYDTWHGRPRTFWVQLVAVQGGHADTWQEYRATDVGTYHLRVSAR